MIRRSKWHRPVDPAASLLPYNRLQLPTDIASEFLCSVRCLECKAHWWNFAGYADSQERVLVCRRQHEDLCIFFVLPSCTARAWANTEAMRLQDTKYLEPPPTVLPAIIDIAARHSKFTKNPLLWIGYMNQSHLLGCKTASCSADIWRLIRLLNHGCLLCHQGRMQRSMYWSVYMRRAGIYRHHLLPSTGLPSHTSLHMHLSRVSTAQKQVCSFLSPLLKPVQGTIENPLQFFQTRLNEPSSQSSKDSASGSRLYTKV